MPTVHTCGDSSLSKREVDKANDGIACIAPPQGYIIRFSDMTWEYHQMRKSQISKN